MAAKNARFSPTVIRFIAVSTIALGLLPVSAQAAEPAMCDHYTYHAGSQAIPAHYKALGLSADQQEKLRAIAAAHQEVMTNNLQRLRDNKKMESALIESADFDESKAQRLVDTEAKIMAENHLATLRFRHEIYQILTPEQRAKLETSRRHRHEARHRSKTN